MHMHRTSTADGGTGTSLVGERDIYCWRLEVADSIPGTMYSEYNVSVVTSTLHTTVQVQYCSTGVYSIQFTEQYR